MKCNKGIFKSRSVAYTHVQNEKKILKKFNYLLSTLIKNKNNIKCYVLLGSLGSGIFGCLPSFGWIIVHRRIRYIVRRPILANLSHNHPMTALRHTMLAVFVS